MLPMEAAGMAGKIDEDIEPVKTEDEKKKSFNQFLKEIPCQIKEKGKRPVKNATGQEGLLKGGEWMFISYDSIPCEVRLMAHTDNKMIRRCGSKYKVAEASNKWSIPLASKKEIK